MMLSPKVIKLYSVYCILKINICLGHSKNVALRWLALG